MNIKIGSNTTEDVKVPLLWGKKAVIEHQDGKISIIDLSGSTARIEVLKDKLGSDIDYRPIDGGYEIQGSESKYMYYPQEKKLASYSGIPQSCTFLQENLLIGGSSFQGNTIIGFGVGIVVGEDGGIKIGAPLPAGLAKLVV